MSDLKITTGGPNAAIEVLAAGTMFLSDVPRPVTFAYDGESITVRPLFEVPPKHPATGNYLLPLPEGALLPGADALHKVGGVSVYVQLRKLARHPEYIGPAEFLFSYEVTCRAVPQLRSVA